MRMYGQCVDCNRFRQVRVSSQGMMRASMGLVPTGECGCREEAARMKREAIRRRQIKDRRHRG
jgi:hypothetical protein